MSTFVEQVCLDHFQGNRTPFTDPLSRGALAGLTLKHGACSLCRSQPKHFAYFASCTANLGVLDVTVMEMSLKIGRWVVKRLC